MSDDIRKTDLKGLNEEYLHIDPLIETYREGIIDVPHVETALKQHNVALLVIDLQYLDAAEGYGVFADVEKSGVPIEAQEYYFKRLHHIVLPNVKRMQEAFRDLKLEVMHTRIQSLTRDGRDRSVGHRKLGLHAPPGSKEAEFLPEIAPMGDEIIINKTASGVFNATNVEYILRNMGIDTLYVCGVYTNECVSTTVRDACDRGFHTTLVNDACATVTPELHNATLSTIKDRYARVMTSDEVVKEIRKAVRT
ncbi:MAG: cysteine hydrolase [Gammaproteobacteria bacterium]|nr:cysteine hydrolase [Gammaproteobacteria bacterium]MDH5800599.1 cysteine hydrolase [Gammaproteobacteria bacterium]